MPKPQRFTFLSSHGRERLDQRTKLTEHEVTELLDLGAFVDIGHEPGFERRRLLFWSSQDQKAFVAIRDGVVGTIVTILPVEYNDARHRKVTEVEIEAARLKYAQRHSDTAKLQLRIHFFSAEGEIKTKDAWKGSRVESLEDLELLLADTAIRRKWVVAIAETGIPIEKIASLSLRKGATKPRVDIPEAAAKTILEKALSMRMRMSRRAELKVEAKRKEHRGDDQERMGPCQPGPL